VCVGKVSSSSPSLQGPGCMKASFTQYHHSNKGCRPQEGSDGPVMAGDPFPTHPWLSIRKYHADLTIKIAADRCVPMSSSNPHPSSPVVEHEAGCNVLHQHIVRLPPCPRCHQGRACSVEVPLVLRPHSHRLRHQRSGNLGFKGYCGRSLRCI